MTEKNTHSILETIKNKLTKFDRNNQTPSENSNVDDEFEYISPKQQKPKDEVEETVEEFIDDQNPEEESEISFDATDESQETQVAENEGVETSEESNSAEGDYDFTPSVSEEEVVVDEVEVESLKNEQPELEDIVQPEPLESQEEVAPEVIEEESAPTESHDDLHVEEESFQTAASDESNAGYNPLEEQSLEGEDSVENKDPYNFTEEESVESKSPTPEGYDFSKQDADEGDLDSMEEFLSEESDSEVPTEEEVVDEDIFGEDDLDEGDEDALDDEDEEGDDEDNSSEELPDSEEIQTEEVSEQGHELALDDDLDSDLSLDIEDGLDSDLDLDTEDDHLNLEDESLEDIQGFGDIDSSLDFKMDEFPDSDELPETAGQEKPFEEVPENHEAPPAVEEVKQADVATQDPNPSGGENNYESELEALERELEEQEKRHQEIESKFVPEVEEEAVEEDIEAELERELRGFGSQTASAVNQESENIEASPVEEVEAPSTEEETNYIEEETPLEQEDRITSDLEEAPEDVQSLNVELENKDAELSQELDSLEEEETDNSVVKMENESRKKILNEDTIMQATDSIRKLVDAKKVVSGISNFAQSPALKDLASNMLEPRLERWLNENLADMVEEIVREEIKKILPKD